MGENMTIDNKQEQIWQSLDDYEYRHEFVEEEINVGIAFQIRSLRNRQNLTQGDLAKRMGVTQPLVSSWEDPNYGKYTLGTLRELAKAFDVGLLVRFVPFGLLTDWAANLKPEDVAPPKFSEEQSSRTWLTVLEKLVVHANQPTLDEETPPSEKTPPSVDANMAQAGRVLEYA
jgi:transcriptional regulator with XRE-family HTH domain